RMAETQTLNFGPEWLRALSGGGHGGGSSSSVATSPPLSPALPKYKLADYRYGREEMLALYVKDREIPVDLHDKDFLPILQEEPLPPLALVAFTEEEQRNFSMSVNSAAVLRLMGRGGGPVGPGAPRGRSTSRGRGRGRGDGGFYQRSFDDVEGGFGRGGREMHRSQSWEERGDRRFEKPGRKESVRANYEDVGTGVGGLPVRKHDFTRSESENWRTSRDEANGEDGDEGGWRLAGALRRDSDRWCPPSPDGLRSAVRREVHPVEQPRQRRFPFDAREDERGYRRPRSGSGSLEEDGGSLPEWCLEDAEEETGTFDSSGAFLSLKKAPKEPILEEAELDFRPLEECDEGLEEDGQPRETKNPDGEARRDPDRKQGELRGVETMSGILYLFFLPVVNCGERTSMKVSCLVSFPRCGERGSGGAACSLASRTPVSTFTPISFSLFPFSLSLLVKEAEKMVAYLQDSDDRLAAKSSAPKPAGLPLTHEAALKWFYKDPQGEMQGPFSNPEMTEWFQAGYFTMTLLVKRGCDEVFQPLGEIIKMWGRVPFAPGPAPPPLLGDAGDQERLKLQQELTALNLYQLQQLQYQYLLRQQYAQALAQQKAQALTYPCAHTSTKNLNCMIYNGLTVCFVSCVAWEGSSVWDLPIDSMAQAPTIEQMQQLEKNKAAKVRAPYCLYHISPQEEERRKQEEERRKQEEERREEERRKQEEERQKQEELEALRRCEEEKRLEEAAAVALARQQQEEAKRREQDAARQQELARQRQQQQEALRRLQQQQQQQQLAQMKLPSSSKWGQQSAVTAVAISQSQNALSLAEIQKVEEERERQAREEQRRQQAELLKLQQQQALQEALQPQAKLSGWGSVAKQPAATKSLLEIQREEAQQVKQRKEQGGGSQQPSHPTVTQQNRAQNRAVSHSLTTALSSSVWGSVATSSMGGGAPNWGGESSSIWGDSTNSNMGFWDEAVKEAAQPPPQAPPPARKPNAQKNNKANANLSSSRANKKVVEEEEKLLKLFQGVNKSQQDGFMQWCEQTLHTLNTANNLDVPTFASFLKEVDSPYEVHDYVRAYLGDTSEAKEFAKQFLERRAKQKANQQKEPQAPQNQQPTLKQQQQQQDSVWGVSGTGSQSRYQSNHTSLQQQARFETVTSGKKKKKQKMVRADPSLLGFSVNAASERLNMGEIETVEDF
uniref:GRB10 interacting GYF protein 2 n=1 Tax=Salmo trutta TaxID=8032 RepID=A0A674AHT4_SALTR